MIIIPSQCARGAPDPNQWHHLGRVGKRSERGGTTRNEHLPYEDPSGYRRFQGG
jgi:hypothetical protein